MAQKCVHQSCGKIFTDPEEECHYHPGPPIFHEGQKGMSLAHLQGSSAILQLLLTIRQGWKCCKPRVLTFDEFLAIPPCTVGKHSTTDVPPTIEKKQVNASDIPVASQSSPATPEPSRAPVAAAALPTATPPPPPPESESDDPSLEIPKGKLCRRKGCGQAYTGGSRDNEKCVYHPGAPIFHEGSKGYTCCKRRVLEFDEFMRIEGCETKNRHLFIGSGKKDGKKGGEEMLETVR
jgi:hypothetical protein